MGVLTLPKWLNEYKFQPDIQKAIEGNNNSFSFDIFLKHAQVKVTKRLVDILDYSKEKNISQNKLYLLYHFIYYKTKYLTQFYKDNFLITRDNTDFDTAFYKSEISNRRNKKYKNIVKNHYYNDILFETKSVNSNSPSFMYVIKDLFNNLIIDYKIVTPSTLANLEKNKLPAMLSGLYFRASVMNPYLVFLLAKQYCDKHVSHIIDAQNKIIKKNNKLKRNHQQMKYIEKSYKMLTPTLGWSSYYFGIQPISNITHYVGIDVIPKVCKKTETLHKQFINKTNVSLRKYENDMLLKLSKKTTDIYCKPSESLYNVRNPTLFMKKYKESIDYIYFSPPYYELETYAGENQSTNLYKTYEEWLKSYWTPTIDLCYYCLKHNRYMIYIISGYTHKNIEYDLEKDMTNIAKKKFKLQDTIDLTTSNVAFTKHRKYKETIFIFKKI